MFYRVFFFIFNGGEVVMFVSGYKGESKIVGDIESIVRFIYYRNYVIFFIWVCYVFLVVFFSGRLFGGLFSEIKY